MDRMLTIEEVMDNLHITSKTTMSKLLKASRFPYIKIGKQYLIPETEYTKWLKNKMNTTVYL